MSLRRCLSSLGCPELSLAETLALAGKHGVPLVELRALGGTVDLATYFIREFGTPGMLAAHVQNLPIRIVALNASLHLAGPTAVERSDLAALAPWADAVGARWLRVFDGGTRADAGELAAAAETVRWWRDLRIQNDWHADLMVETHDSLVTGDAIARCVEALPDIAVLWDAHHTWRKGGEDPVLTWKRIRPRVVHVHVKDSINTASARHPFTYVLPGDGDFPIAPLLATLRADSFEGAVSLEWEKLWHPYLPSLDDALATAAGRAWW